MKYFVILGFCAIVSCLGIALFWMMRQDFDPKNKNKRMAFALGMRVAISIFVFLCILFAWKLGYISPTGIREGQ